MDLDISLDVNVARLAHVGWELELERLAFGGPVSKAPHIHADCDFGRWIYTRGLRKYGDFQDTWQLKDVHNSFHDIADDIIQMKLEGHDAEARDLVAKMRTYSREIVYLLTSLELAVMHKKYPTSTVVKTLRVLGQFFGGDVEPQPFPMYFVQRKLPWFAFRRKRLAKYTSMLDINAARMNHVMWVKNLEMAFSRFNRKKLLPDGDQCSLGVWIHTIGRDDFLGDEEFEDLNKIHMEFHNRSQYTLDALHRNDLRGADRSFQKVIQASADIVYHLTHLELKMQGSRMLARRMKTIIL